MMAQKGAIHVSHIGTVPGTSTGRVKKEEGVINFQLRPSILLSWYMPFCERERGTNVNIAQLGNIWPNNTHTMAMKELAFHTINL